MAEVIGKNFKDVVNCKVCGSKVRFEKRDVWPGEQEVVDDDWEHRCFVTCPNKSCGKPIDVTTNVGPMSEERFQQYLQEHDNYS